MLFTLRIGSIYEIWGIRAKFIIIRCAWISVSKSFIGFQHNCDIRYGVISCFFFFRICCHLIRGRFMLQMTYVYKSTPTPDSRMKNQIHCHLHPLIVTHQANHTFCKCNLRIGQRRCPNMSTGLIILLYCYQEALGNAKIFHSWIHAQHFSETSDWKKFSLCLSVKLPKIWFVVIIFSSINPF